MTYPNETLRLIDERRSIRKFTAEPLTEVQITILTQAALASPSAINGQPWRFHFITNQEVISIVNDAALMKFDDDGNQAVFDRLAERKTRSIFYGAPLLVIITVTNDDKTGYAMIDAGIAAENIVIAAQSIGLGSCIIGMADAAFFSTAQATVRSAIQMADDHVFAISIAIGHPAMSKVPHKVLPDRLIRID